MRLTVKQVEKTSLDARFEILRGSQGIGSAAYSSFVESSQGNWTGRLGADAFELAYGRSRALAVGLDELRSYELSVNGRACGNIVREGSPVATLDALQLFSARLELGGRALEVFPFSRGRAGYRYPVFDGARQVAEFAKECKVVDDLNDFEIAVADDSDALCTVALCCYVFCQSWWRPGPPRHHHKHFYIQKKTRPGTDFYDPGFFESVGL